MSPLRALAHNVIGVIGPTETGKAGCHLDPLALGHYHNL